MQNLVYLVGRIEDEPDFHNFDDKKELKITVSIQRNTKNEDGEYEKDVVHCILCGKIGTSFIDYCKKGDLVGIKGSIRTNNEHTSEVIVDKISFIASKRNDMER